MDLFTFCFITIAAINIEGAWCKNSKYHDGDGGKIVGGNDTSIQTYPYQAYLLLYDGKKYYQCGGSIISKSYIVTAAHCLTGIQRIYVRIGSTQSTSGGTQYQTTMFRAHPKYNRRTSDYDAGIVKIQKGMNLDGTNAKSIQMVPEGYDPSQGNLILTGWGTTSENGNTSSNLKVVKIPVISRTRCKELLGNGITTRMVCAGVAEGGKDTCQGDSGGPAVSTNNAKLVGITSFGYGCARPNSPGVYALVGNTEIRSFIKTMTGI